MTNNAASTEDREGEYFHKLAVWKYHDSDGRIDVISQLLVDYPDRRERTLEFCEAAKWFNTVRPWDITTMFKKLDTPVRVSLLLKYLDQAEGNREQYAIELADNAMDIIVNNGDWRYAFEAFNHWAEHNLDGKARNQYCSNLIKSLVQMALSVNSKRPHEAIEGMDKALSLRKDPVSKDVWKKIMDKIKSMVAVSSNYSPQYLHNVLECFQKHGMDINEKVGFPGETLLGYFSLIMEGRRKEQVSYAIQTLIHLGVDYKDPRLELSKEVLELIERTPIILRQKLAKGIHISLEESQETESKASKPKM